MHSPVWPQLAPIQWWSDLFLDNSKMVSNYYRWLSEWKIYIILLQLLQAQSLKSTIHHLETIWHVLFTWSWQLRLHSQQRRGIFFIAFTKTWKTNQRPKGVVNSDFRQLVMDENLKIIHPWCSWMHYKSPNSGYNL